MLIMQEITFNDEQMLFNGITYKNGKEESIWLSQMIGFFIAS